MAFPLKKIGMGAGSSNRFYAKAAAVIKSPASTKRSSGQTIIHKRRSSSKKGVAFLRACRAAKPLRTRKPDDAPKQRGGVHKQGSVRIRADNLGGFTGFARLWTVDQPIASLQTRKSRKRRMITIIRWRTRRKGKYRRRTWGLRPTPMACHLRTPHLPPCPWARRVRSLRGVRGVRG